MPTPRGREPVPPMSPRPDPAAPGEARARAPMIPYGTQCIEDDDIAAVVETLRQGPLTQGPKVLAFERALAERVGARYCVAFCNATAGLQCAVKALDIAPGRNGVTSPNTFVASANCLAYNGLVPRFADIDPRTFNVTAETLARQIDGGTSVLVPVHFAGQACDMEPIAALAALKGIPVIEDAAHALGSVHLDGSPVGSCRHSAMTVFSFHPVKTLTTGEGGAVTTNDPVLFERLKLLRSHGITKDPALLQDNPGPWYYEQQELGFNFRITDIQCALGLSQLAKLDRFKSRRREIIEAYHEAFRGMVHVRPPFETPGLDSCLHLYVLRIDFEALGTSRGAVMARLLEQGIGSQVHYIPVHLQPWYRRQYGFAPGHAPVAEATYAQALSIPLYPAMGEAEVERVIAAIRSLE